MGRRGWHTLAITSAQYHTIGREPLTSSSEEWRVWISHLVPQLLPKHLAVKASRCPWDPQTSKQSSNGCMNSHCGCPRKAQCRGTRQTRLPSLSLKEVYFCTFKAAEGQASNLAGPRSCLWFSPQPREAGGHTFHLLPIEVTSMSVEGACTHICAWALADTQEMSPDHLALVAIGAFIHESHRTVTISNGHRRKGQANWSRSVEFLHLGL